MQNLEINARSELENSFERELTISMRLVHLGKVRSSNVPTFEIKIQLFVIQNITGFRNMKVSNT